MADTTRTIRIKIDSKQAVKKVDQLDDKMDGLKTSVSKVAAAVALAFAVRPLIKYSDEFKNLQNQLRLVTKGTQNLADVTNELFEVAQKSRTSFSATGELYAKLARSTESLGTSQSDLIRITETINKSFAISGATAQEAENAIRQLGQGLSAGALRGDEFNSVAEQAPGILRAVAAETGKSIGELRAFAAEGKITTDLLVRSLQNYASVVDGEFAQANITISQSTTVFENSFMRLVGVLDEVGGASSGVSSLIVELSGAIDDLSDSVVSGAVGEVFSSQFDIISREIATALDGIREFYNSILNEVGITSEGVDGALKAAFTGYVPTVVASVKATILTLKTLVNFVDLTAKQIRQLMSFDGLGDDIIDMVDLSPFEKSLKIIGDGFTNTFKNAGEFLDITGALKSIESGVESVGSAVADTDLAKGAAAALGEYQLITSEYERQLNLIVATRDADIERTTSAIDNAQKLLEAFRAGGGTVEDGKTPETGDIIAPVGEMPIDQQIEFFNAKHVLLDNDLAFWEMYNSGRVSLSEIADQAILASAQRTAMQRASIERMAQLATLSSTNQTLQLIQQVAGEGTAVAKAAFIAQKGIAAANSIISGIEAGMRIRAQLGVFAEPMASIVTGLGYANAGLIAATGFMGSSGGGARSSPTVGAASSTSTASSAPAAPVAQTSDQVQTLDTGALINELRNLGSEPIPASFAARILEAIPEARQITGEG